MVPLSNARSSTKEDSSPDSPPTIVSYTYEEVFTIEDFSTNGTYLNGKRLNKGEQVPIKNNDEIGIVVVIDETNGSKP